VFKITLRLCGRAIQNIHKGDSFMPDSRRPYDLDAAWEYCKEIISADVLRQCITDSVHVIFDTHDGTFSNYCGGYVVASDDFGNPHPRFVDVYCFPSGDLDPAGDHHHDADKYSETEEEYNELFMDSMLSELEQQFYARHDEREREAEMEAAENAFARTIVPQKLSEPAKWRSTKQVFVNSMSDLFHKDVPDDYIEAVCQVMEQADWHIYQVLTKRSERLRDLLTRELNWAAHRQAMEFTC
jgi:hypothetical protein